MLLEPGAIFDRYTIEAFLGEGGMGEVYRAHDARLHRKIALKVLRVEVNKEGMSTKEASARLLREARAAAQLNHPNAVAIFDVGEVDGAPYIAMELIEGRSLRAFIGDASVGQDRRMRWLLDVASAVGAAHKRGLVHRDVKPENVMIREDGRVKVLDFGIARRTKVDGALVAPGDAFTTLTGKGRVIGTPYYMAPEQMLGETVDGRADQFAWGVVAYELLSGKLPWTTDGGALVAVAEVLSKDPPRLSSCAANVSDALNDLVMKALSKTPANRFARMEDVVTVLDALARTSARNDTLALEAAVAREPDVVRHALPARYLVDIDAETGQFAAAGKVADAFLKRKDAWSADPRVDDMGIANDVTPLMLHALRRAGTLSRGAYVEERKRWVETWRQTLPALYGGFLWVAGYAVVADDADDAREALAALDQFGPLPKFLRLSTAEAAQGKVVLLAGRAADAFASEKRGGCMQRAFAAHRAHARSSGSRAGGRRSGAD